MLPAPAGLTRANLWQSAAWIDGHAAEAPQAIDVRSPRDGRVIGAVPSLDEAQVEGAIAAAARAFVRWRATSTIERSNVLRRWADLVREHARDLALILSTEQGKPLSEAEGEVRSSAAYLQWFAEEARRVYGTVIPANEQGQRLTVIRQPVGVVAAITPWNFPSAMIARKVAPALATGCTVVLKPSELTPFSATALAVLGHEAGVPAGVFNVVTGDAAMIGRILTGSPTVRKLSFTGSTAVGKMLAARCAETVKRVSLELGGNAPFLVFDDADLDRAVAAAVQAKFRNNGQTCVCANRFLVQQGIHDAFAARLAEAVRVLRCGDTLADPAVTQGPLIDGRAAAKLRRHIADAVGRGARVLAGGEAGDTGLFAPATVLTEVPASALVFAEETFGPLAAITRFDTEEEAIALANSGRAGLAAYVMTRDLDRAHRVSEALEYGMVGLNTGLVSSEVAPFGGVKESGYGREGSLFGVDDYVDVKLVCASA